MFITSVVTLHYLRFVSDNPWCITAEYRFSVLKKCWHPVQINDDPVRVRPFGWWKDLSFVPACHLQAYMTWTSQT